MMTRGRVTPLTDKVPRMTADEAIGVMSAESGVSLARASAMIGMKSRTALGTMLYRTRMMRKKHPTRRHGPMSDTLADVAKAMGFRLVLVGHGHVIEVVSERKVRGDE